MRELGLSVLVGLASFRLWRLVAVDTILVRPRVWVLFRDVDDGEFRRWGRRLSYFVNCPWCLGAWISAAVTAWTDARIDGGLRLPLLVWAAASGVVGVLGQLLDEGEWS